MDILLEKNIDIETPESGSISFQIIVRQDEDKIQVSVGASLWQNEREFRNVSSYSDESNIEITGDLRDDYTQPR